MANKRRSKSAGKPTKAKTGRLSDLWKTRSRWVDGSKSCCWCSALGHWAKDCPKIVGPLQAEIADLKERIAGLEALLDDPVPGVAEQCEICGFVLGSPSCERRHTSKPKLMYCDICDGCGWLEGGIALQTKCNTCNGTGTVEAK